MLYKILLWNWDYWEYLKYIEWYIAKCQLWEKDEFDILFFYIFIWYHEWWVWFINRRIYSSCNCIDDVLNEISKYISIIMNLTLYII